VARLEGDLDQARTFLVDVLAQFQGREFGPAMRADRCIMAIGMLAIQWGDGRRGVILIGAGKGIRETMYAKVMRAENEASLAAARSVLGEDAFAMALAEGEAMTQAQAIAYALEADETA
jgi:hypothetical protein